MNLTGKEIEIIGHLADGLGIKQIHSLVGLSYNTTANYVRYLRMKLGAINTAHIVSIAYKRGILTIKP